MEKKNFTKADLKVGYVVKLRNGVLYMVMVDDDERLVLISEGRGWLRLHEYNDDLTDSNTTSLFGIPACEKYDIMEVYGYSRLTSEAMSVNTNNRSLLWKREEKPMRMTLAEIEAALGFKIAIVREDDK